MSTPANFNLTIYQGDTFTSDFQLIQNIGGEDQPVPLSGFTPLSQIRLRPEDEEVIAEFQVEITDAEEGKFRLFMDNDQTRFLPRVSFYDFQTVDDIDGSVKTWLAGKINSPREVSRDYEDGE